MEDLITIVDHEVEAVVEDEDEEEEDLKTSLW